MEKEYIFCVAMYEETPGFSVPREHWADNAIDIPWSGVIRITLKTEAWDAVPESPPRYECAPELFGIFQDWLHSACCLHGYTINPQRYSPQDLVEALAGWKYPWKIEAGTPQDEPSRVDIDLDANGYGEMSLDT